MDQIAKYFTILSNKKFYSKNYLTNHHETAHKCVLDIIDYRKIVKDIFPTVFLELRLLKVSKTSKIHEFWPAAQLHNGGEKNRKNRFFRKSVYVRGIES